MTRLPWAELMRLGLCELRVPPEVFWALTPRELMIIAGASHDARGILDRAGLEALMRRNPDRADTTEDNG